MFDVLGAKGQETPRSATESAACKLFLVNGMRYLYT